MMTALSDLGTWTSSVTFFSSHASSSFLALSTFSSALAPLALTMNVVRLRLELASIATPSIRRCTSLITSPRVVGTSRRSLEKPRGPLCAYEAGGEIEMDAVGICSVVDETPAAAAGVDERVLALGAGERSLVPSAAAAGACLARRAAAPEPHSDEGALDFPLATGAPSEGKADSSETSTCEDLAVFWGASGAGTGGARLAGGKGSWATNPNGGNGSSVRTWVLSDAGVCCAASCACWMRWAAERGCIVGGSWPVERERARDQTGLRVRVAASAVPV